MMLCLYIFNKILPYPNPFLESVKVDMELKESCNFKFVIYNIRGQKVRNLESGLFSKGKHTIARDGCNERGSKVSAGVYILRLSTKIISHTRRMIMMK
jgi:flagellar hook assembly protein FlgD